MKKKLRNAEEAEFDFRSKCLFCAEIGSEAVERRKATDRRKVITSVCTLNFRPTLLEKCDQRNDDWSRDVRRRCTSVLCLVAAEAKYHRQCYVNFCKLSTGRKCDHPEDAMQTDAFEKLCQYIRGTDECQYFMKDLLTLMGAEAFQERYLQKKLKETFKNEIGVHIMLGCGTIVCFRNVGNKILVEVNSLTEAGNDVLLAFYNASSWKSVNEHRYDCFQKAVAVSKHEVLLASLPPTAAAPKQHYLRAYLQVQKWLGANLSPTDWGWQCTQNGLEPVMTNEPPIP